jgi:hypothetical protein
MGGLTRVLAGLLACAARLLPAGRRQWAQAVGAEASVVAAGWPRLRWLAGGLWLAAREVAMMRKVVYVLGAAAVAAGLAWTVWLSWRADPASDPLAVTDRVRVLVGAAALIVLPWVGRRHGWFGPVGSSITARLVRVAGCAAVCGLGVVAVRIGNQVGQGPHGPNPFSVPREVTGLVLAGAALAAFAVVRARWPETDPVALRLCGACAVVLEFAALPCQALVVLYVAGILAATSRRSPVATASLGAGVACGLACALATGLIVRALNTVDDTYIGLQLTSIVTIAFMLGCLAGVAAAWLLPGTGDPGDPGDPGKLRAARGRQGLLAGAVTGGACGLALTSFLLLAVIVMVIGPLLGAAGGILGGYLAADHPRTSLPGRSRAAGLLARF